MARIRLRLLGGLEIFDSANQPIQLSVKKAKALLVYLAVQPHIGFSRDHLAELLWPKTISDRARQSLRQAIADLRKHLPSFDNVISVTHNTLQANESNLSVDLLNFEHLAKLQDPHAHNEAFCYYRGPFLEGFSIHTAPFTAWHEEITLAAHEQSIYVIESLSEHQLLEGNSTGAIELCQQLVKIDPVRESAHRNLMGLYAKQGNTNAALEQYADCCRKLKRILGTEPEAQTKYLYARIKKQIHLSAENKTPTKAIPNNKKENDKTFIPQCIGRESEMSMVCACIEHTFETKQGQCILISGIDGIGKSYFLAKTSEHAQQLNMATAQTRFFDINNSHENGLRDLILSITRSPSLPDRNEIAIFIADQYFNKHPKYNLYLATLYSLLDLQIPKRMLATYSALKPATRDILTKTVITKIITQVSDKTPLLIIIDDSQYVTASTRFMIRALLNLTRKLPIIIICATSQNSDTIIENTRDIPVTSLKMTPLSREYTRRIFPEFQSTQSIDLLYLIWLQRALQYSVTPQADNLTDILKNLRSALNEEDIRALDIATVLGIRFSPEVLKTLLDNPQYIPDGLIQQGYLQNFGNMLEFTHSITQQILYSLLDKNLRNNIHFNAASYYLFGNTHLHASHLAAANSPDTAKAYISAALSAGTDFKPELAIYFYEKASDHAVDNQEKYFAAIHKAELLLESDRIALAVQSYDHAQKYAANQQQQIHAWLGMAKGLLAHRQFTAALNLLERCESILTTTSDHKTLAKIYYYLAQAVFNLNMSDAAIRYSKIAFEHAKLAETSYWQANIAFSLGTIEFTQLQLAKAFSDLGFALRLAQENNHDELEIKILTVLAKVKLFQADFQGSTHDLEKVMNTASMIEDHQQMLEILCVLCLLDFYKGQFTRLQHHAELATDLCKLIGPSERDNYIASYQLLAACHCSDSEQHKQQIKDIKRTLDLESVTSYVLDPVKALTETDTAKALLYLNNTKKNLSSLDGPAALECCFLSIEAAILHKLWDMAVEFSDRLIALIKDEHLHVFIMCAKRVRVLSQIDQDDMTETTRAELVDILVSAKHFGLEIHLPAYKMALNQLRDPIQV